MAASIDDPLTDSQKPSTTTTTATTPAHLGSEKAGSNTSSCRAPRASWRQQGLITQPETGTQGSDCVREQSRPGDWTNHFLFPPEKDFVFPVTGFPGFVTAPSCCLSSDQHVASASSLVYPPAL